MQSLIRRLLAGIGAAGILVGSAGVAQADDISNNLDASVDAAAEVMSLNVGGPAGTTELYVTPQNGDGKNGCNLTRNTTLVLSISSSNTGVATVSPSSVTFTSCGDTQELTVTPVGEGLATVSASQTSNNSGGTFNLAPAAFTVNVAAPSNTAPSISVAGVTGGASYAKGSVPPATCQVTDKEDGNSSFAATLSAVTGPHASDGIGSQTASCSYTDQGGLTASASETYSIVDPTAPSVGYTLDPEDPDGSNGWYTSDVTLAWNVADLESPSSLERTGCVDQEVTIDQVETTYSCSATSAGGSTGQVDVKVKRDGTAPFISGEDVNDSTWSNTAVSESFTAEDATSGLADSADATFTLTAADESVDADTPTTVSKTVRDEAGNSTTRTLSAFIDHTAPVVSVHGVSDDATYTVGSVPAASCSTTDALSGVKEEAAPTRTGGSVGEVTVTCAGAEDHAGNTATASVTFRVHYPWTGFFSPVDMGTTVLNKAKAGSAIPLKFSLGGDRGLSIIAAGFPKTFSIPCSSSATVDQIEELAGTTSGLKYDSLAGQYNYTWKTSTTLAGKCVRLDMTLIDGSTHSANFQFTK